MHDSDAVVRRMATLALQGGLCFSRSVLHVGRSSVVVLGEATVGNETIRRVQLVNGVCY